MIMAAGVAISLAKRIKQVNQYFFRLQLLSYDKSQLWPDLIIAKDTKST
jgi:hypothetical protein